ncbi:MULTISPECIES: hypothetical protein [Methylobacterium]|uniref:hypothetical protein n=1 Tax=Methylobacterium TaxID=407 RepID=UPI00272E2CB8|nr:hypothetical protein [Methylobacterium sp.]
MVKSVDWKALRKTATYTVEGQDVTYRKRGTPRLLDKIARNKVLGDAIQHLIGSSLKSKASTVDALKDAVAAAAEDSGLDAGKVLRELVTSVPTIVIEILVEDTVLASEDERADYRDWVEQLGPSGLVDAITGWVDLNMPEFRAPLVRALAAVLQQGGAILSAVQAAARGQTAGDAIEAAKAA